MLQITSQLCELGQNTILLCLSFLPGEMEMVISALEGLYED